MIRQGIAATRAIASTTGVSQDNIIFGLVLLAFVVYITVKGELPTYLGFFTPQHNLGPPTDNVAGATGSGSGSTVVPPTTNPITGAQIQPGLTNNPTQGLTGGSGFFGTNIGTGIAKLFGF